jgi:hypothetical protein
MIGPEEEKDGVDEDDDVVSCDDASKLMFTERFRETFGCALLVLRLCLCILMSSVHVDGVHLSSISFLKEGCNAGLSSFDCFVVCCG